MSNTITITVTITITIRVSPQGERDFRQTQDPQVWGPNQEDKPQNILTLKPTGKTEVCGEQTLHS